MRTIHTVAARLWIVVALIFGLCPLVGSAQPNPLSVTISEADTRSNPPQVNLLVSVVDEAGGQGAILGLPADAFSVSQVNKPVSFEMAEEDVGMALVILMDASGSMNEPGVPQGRTRMDTQRDLVVGLIDQLTTKDLVGVIGFHDNMVNPLDLTHDMGAVYNTAVQYRAEGTFTSIFDTAGQAIDWLTDNSDPVKRAELQRMRKAILLLSDGTDTGSKIWNREDVRARSLAAGIKIHAIAVDSPPGQTRTYRSNPADLQWLASQTRGEYYHIDSQDKRSAAEGFLQKLVSQRTQYRLSFISQLAKGAHQVGVLVTLPTGQTAQADFTMLSSLEAPILRIVEPNESTGLIDYLSDKMPVPIVAEVLFPDNQPRPLQRVEFFVGNISVGEGGPVPESNRYQIMWDPSSIPGNNDPVTATISLRATDSWLVSQVIVPVNDVSIQVRPQAPPINTGLIVSNIAMGLLVLALLVFLLLTRRQIATMAQRVGRTTGALVRTMTKPLVGGGPATAKLKVINGPNVGAEYKIDRDRTAIGRDSGQCEIILPDPYVSGLHVVIERQSSTVYTVIHEGRNPTELNRSPLPPKQPVPLPFNSVIKVGTTEMEFTQVGGTTVQI